MHTSNIHWSFVGNFYGNSTECWHCRIMAHEPCCSWLFYNVIGRLGSALVLTQLTPKLTLKLIPKLTLCVNQNLARNYLILLYVKSIKISFYCYFTALQATSVTSKTKNFTFSVKKIIFYTFNLSATWL